MGTKHWLESPIYFNLLVRADTKSKCLPINRKGNLSNRFLPKPCTT